MGNSSSEQSNTSCGDIDTKDNGRPNTNFPMPDKKESSERDMFSPNDLHKFEFKPFKDTFQLPKEDLLSEKPRRTFFDDVYKPEEKNSLNVKTNLRDFEAEVCREEGNFTGCIGGTVNPFEKRGGPTARLTVKW